MSEVDTTRLPPPRLVTWVALAVCAAGVVMVLLGAWRIGIWTDEPAHVIRYENMQEHGWYLLDDDFDGDEPADWVTDQYVYAPVTTHVMHGVNRVLGLDPAGALGTSVRAYSVRHLVVGVIGLLGVLAVASIGRRLLGSWSWGAVAAATLFAIPMWPGLSMFDIKDVPAATGYTFVTWGLVEMVARPLTGPARGRARVAVWPVAVLTIGLLLAIGTRPGLWPGLAAAVVAAFAASLVLPVPSGSTERRTRWRVLLVSVAVSGVLAYALLLLSYPAYFSRPDQWLMRAVGDSSQYTGTSQHADAGSWAYVPSRVLALVMPPALLLLGVLGLLLALARRPPRRTPELAGWLLVASQGLLLPVLAMIRQSQLGDDLRQLAFATPAVALLLTLGWRLLGERLGTVAGAARSVFAVVWAAALLLPVAAQIQLFPYSYSYVAPHASALGAVVQDDWARLSLRELLPEVPRDEYVVCGPTRTELGDTRRSGMDCATDPFATLTPFHLATAEDVPAVADTFVAVYTRGALPGRNCQELGRVERGRYFGRAVMSRVARCDLVLDPYPTTGVRFGPGGQGEDYFLTGGWNSDGLDAGVKVPEPSGSLGVTLPESWGPGSLTVVVEGESPVDPEVRVNNEPVTVVRVPAGWQLSVSEETAEAMGEHRLVLTLATRPGQPLVLEGITVEPAGDVS